MFGSLRRVPRLDDVVVFCHGPRGRHTVKLHKSAIIGDKLTNLDLFHLIYDVEDAVVSWFVDGDRLAAILAIFVLLKQSDLLLDVLLREQIFVALLGQTQPASILDLLKFSLRVHETLLVDKHCRVSSIGQAIGDDLGPASLHYMDTGVVKSNPSLSRLLVDIRKVVVVAEDDEGAKSIPLAAISLCKNLIEFTKFEIFRHAQ